MNYANGDMYIGDWDRGQRHGVGICTYANGDVYEGEWFCDKRHGFGVFDYAGGDHFEGNWVDDCKEGQGVHFYYHKDKKVHTKRYDGEWVNDVPKCGAYTEMPPDPLVAASYVPDPIPAVQLVDANAVLGNRLAEVRAERAAHRTARIKLEDHFTPEELDALRAAFERTDIGETGAISRDQLPSAFSQVGMAPTEEQVSAVIAQLGRPDDHAATFTFADFARAADMLSPVEQ